MNAAEARAKSLSNIPKLVDSFVSTAITEINSDIKQAVNVGHSFTRKTLSIPKALENDVINKLESHYQKLGYGIDVRDFFKYKMIYISWMS
jgi:hypothetical protein